MLLSRPHPASRRWRSAQRSRAGLAALLLAAGLAACGHTAATTQAALNPDIHLANCLRSHGVPNLPDPGPAGLNFGPGSNIDPQSPAFEAAMKACARFAAPPAAPTPMSAAKVRTALHLAACLRTHGVPGFPDPVSAPGANQQVLSLKGLFFPITIDFRTLVGSPAFRTALQQCGFALPRAQARAVRAQPS